ncbi:MAG: prolipoprotein diacylglyceryl transferase [Myxococcota bacterium]
MNDHFHWDVERVLFHLGPLEIRAYGLIFATGLLVSIHMMQRSFRDRGLPDKHASTLSLLLPIGMIIGAHLVHLIFYEPRSILENPVRIIEIGRGLASHGGGVGVALALLWFTRRHGVSWHRYADAVMVGAVWMIAFVRIGNFFNSEIVGRATDVPWGVVFVQRGEHFARHPSQLYETILGIALIGLAMFMHGKRDRLRDGATLYTVLAVYFGVRFGLEYFKEYQAQTLTPEFPFTMGQLLSGPVALLCGYMALFSRRCGLLSSPKPSGPDGNETEGKIRRSHPPTGAR